MKRVKQHHSVEAAWSYLLHLEDEDTGDESKVSGAATAASSPAVTPAATHGGEAQEDIPLDTQLLHLNDGAKLIIVLVGKPARGKTFLAAKIQRYCEWLGYRVKHTETVAIRREMFGKVEPDDFFNPNSVEMTQHRRQAQEKSLDMALDFLRKGGQVVIYDASNSTAVRRKWVKDYVKDHLPAQTNESSPQVASHRLVFVESVCEDVDLIKRNFLELRRKNPKFDEYKGLPESEAIQKFMDKLKFYDKEYEPVDGDKEDVSFIRLVDFGKQLVSYKIRGFLESKLVSFMMNIHTEPRVIILVRHGQSEYNLQDRIGGDPPLTEAGHEFASNLASYIAKEAANGMQNGSGSSSSEDNPFKFEPSKDLFVWTSNLKRTVDTVAHIKCRATVPWAALAEIDAGVCECMTYKDFKEKLSTQYMKRQMNKYSWRYPGGESYLDVKSRLEPVIFELERQRKPVVVCAHRAVLRCLYSYFVGISIKQAPFLPFPLHTMLVLTPTSSGWREDRIPIEPDVGDLGAHEQDVQAAASKIIKSQAKKRRLAKEEADMNAS